MQTRAGKKKASAKNPPTTSALVSHRTPGSAGKKNAKNFSKRKAQPSIVPFLSHGTDLLLPSSPLKVSASSGLPAPPPDPSFLGRELADCSPPSGETLDPADTLHPARCSDFHLNSVQQDWEGSPPALPVNAQPTSPLAVSEQADLLCVAPIIQTSLPVPCADQMLDLPSTPSTSPETSITSSNAIEPQLPSATNPTKPSASNCIHASADCGGLNLQYPLQVATSINLIFSYLQSVVKLLKNLLKEPSSSVQQPSSPHCHWGSENPNLDYTCKLHPTSLWERKSSQLILQPSSIVLTIPKDWRNPSDWGSPKHAKAHLASLLGLRFPSIDLAQLDKLSSTNSYSKLLLSFSSCRIPKLLHQHSEVLSKHGISTQRYFKDTQISSLLQPKPHLQDTRTPPVPSFSQQPMAPSSREISNSQHPSTVVVPQATEAVTKPPFPPSLPPAHSQGQMVQHPLLSKTGCGPTTSTLPSDFQPVRSDDPVPQDPISGAELSFNSSLLKPLSDTPTDHTLSRVSPGKNQPITNQEIVPAASSYPLSPSCIITKRSSKGAFQLVDALNQKTPPLDFTFSREDVPDFNIRSATPDSRASSPPPC